MKPLTRRLWPLTAARTKGVGISSGEMREKDGTIAATGRSWQVNLRVEPRLARHNHGGRQHRVTNGNAEPGVVGWARTAPSRAMPIVIELVERERFIGGPVSPDIVEAGHRLQDVSRHRRHPLVLAASRRRALGRLRNPGILDRQHSCLKLSDFFEGLSGWRLPRRRMLLGCQAGWLLIVPMSAVEGLPSRMNDLVVRLDQWHGMVWADRPNR